MTMDGHTVEPLDAVMFDIDDTLIYSETGKIIEPVYEIYKKVKNAGYNIVIVTARPHFPDNVLWTRSQLAEHDITYDALVFATPENKGYYKRESHYNFILSVGDMDTDLTDSLYTLKISK
jgi:hydroxymethylpyrimidine pyrophosphatase-like HAD family hydrolase